MFASTTGKSLVPCIARCASSIFESPRTDSFARRRHSSARRKSENPRNSRPSSESATCRTAPFSVGSRSPHRFASAFSIPSRTLSRSSSVTDTSPEIGSRSVRAARCSRIASRACSIVAPLRSRRFARASGAPCRATSSRRAAERSRSAATASLAIAAGVRSEGVGAGVSAGGVAGVGTPSPRAESSADVSGLVPFSFSSSILVSSCRLTMKRGFGV